MKKHTAVYGLIAVSALVLSACSNAGSGAPNEFPNGPIEIIVPFSAGGTTDLLARTMAEEMSSALDEDVVVVNKEGASGVVGVAEAANATPDGNTLLVTTESPIARGSIEEVPYGPTDFTALTPIGETTYVVAVQEASEWTSLDDIAAETDSVQYAAAGVGTFSHVSLARLLDEMDVDNVSVPYDGLAPAAQALLGGNADLSSLEPLHISQDLRPLAVTSQERLEEFPDVPTFAEEGYPDSAYSTTFALLAPAGIDSEILNTLKEASVTASDSERMEQFRADNILLPFDHDNWIEHVEKITERYGEDVEHLGLLD